MAVVASRSSLVGALLRIVVPVDRTETLDFLRGLSRDELECLAEFEGSWCIEAAMHSGPAYRLLAAFFDPASSERWLNADDCAHKTFVVLEWLEFRSGARATRAKFGDMGRNDSVQAA